jgi:hypothetical protein
MIYGDSAAVHVPDTSPAGMSVAVSIRGTIQARRTEMYIFFMVREIVVSL